MTLKTAETELKKQYSHQEVENKWIRLWEEKDLFKTQIKAGKDKFSIALPPPNVTGELHMGHALGGTIQDVLLRYHRMLGKNVLWQIGTDHAGIGTQLVVEKHIKKTEKINRHTLGREAFIERVKVWKEDYGNKIIEQMKLLGFSPDYSRCRYTMDEHYSKAVQEAFIKYFNDGLIYRGKRIVNWCPQCLTSLSDLELDKQACKKKLYEIKYQIKDRKEALVVATTRPETMFGDTALAINPKDERYQELIKEIQAKPGSVSALIPFTNKEIPVVLDEHVKLDFGTGALKVTPAHDANDYEIGKRHDLEQVIIMDEKAMMLDSSDVPEQFHGLDRYKARDAVVEALVDSLVKVSEYEQEKDLHDRCANEIEPYLSDQWYVDMKKLAATALNTVCKDKRSQFTPERYEGMFKTWLENIQDWCISRQIWWGHRIPVFYYDASVLDDSSNEKDIKCFAAKSAEDSDLDKETLAKLQELQAKSPEEKIFWQDEDVLDTWFSSALWPFETMKEGEKEIFETFYPTDVLATAREIINLWVSRMIYSGEYFEGKEPFKDILIHPVVQTPDGKRMSKSKGNAINPLDLVELYGADASRMWYASVGVYSHQDVKFPGKHIKRSLTEKSPDARLANSEEPELTGSSMRISKNERNAAAGASQSGKIWVSDTMEQYRKFANKLYNASKFVMMQLDQQEGFKAKPLAELDTSKFDFADTWIVAKLDDLLKTVNDAFAHYDLATVQDSIYSFIWFDFCDWYIEFSKVKTNKSDTETKPQILFNVLEQSLRALQPIMPCITEEIWQVLKSNYALDAEAEYIAFAEYPQAFGFEKEVDTFEKMDFVTEVISSVRNSRQSLGISWSQEIEFFVEAENDFAKECIQSCEAYIRAICKLKSLNFGQSAAKPSSIAMLSGTKLTIPLEGILDLSKLKEDINKRVAKLEKDMSGLEARLASEKFVNNADPAKVQEVRDQLAELQAKKQEFLEVF